LRTITPRMPYPKEQKAFNSLIMKHQQRNSCWLFTQRRWRA